MSNDTIALLVFGATYIGAAVVFWKAMDAAYKRGKKDGTIVVEVGATVEVADKKKIDEAYRAGYRTGVEEVTEVVDAEKRESEVK